MPVKFTKYWRSLFSLANHQLEKEKLRLLERIQKYEEQFGTHMDGPGNIEQYWCITLGGGGTLGDMVI